MIASISSLYKWEIIATDIAVLTLVYFIPVLTHLSPFPLYYLDPMRLLLFAGYLISRNNANAYLLALTIPIFSTLISGHPPFYKAVLIAVELLVNVGLLHFLFNQLKWHAGLALFVSTISSKVFYYGFKFIFIHMGLIEGELITTSLWVQLATIIFLTLLFTFSYNRRVSA